MLHLHPMPFLSVTMSCVPPWEGGVRGSPVLLGGQLCLQLWGERTACQGQVVGRLGLECP